MATTEPNWDIEEQDSELEDDYSIPLKIYEAKQRELVTSVVDFNLSVLSDLTGNTIDVSPRYQRRERWDDKRQSLLIESFLLNVPVPPIFLNEDRYGKYSVIDGKQRLLAIKAFLTGELALTGLQAFKELEGMKISDLPDDLRGALITRPTVRTTILLKQSDQRLKYLVFYRLNTGGVRLNAQEIRNTAFPGPLNDLLFELSELPKFREMVRILKPEKSALYQQMRDVELVLRFLTFQGTWKKYDGGIRQHLDTWMEENKHASVERLKKMSRVFRATLDAVEAAFGDFAFRRWVPAKVGEKRTIKETWHRNILVALYDAEMIACSGYKVADLLPFQDELIEMKQVLCADPLFESQIIGATNTPSYFIGRIKRLQAEISGRVDS